MARWEDRERRVEKERRDNAIALLRRDLASQDTKVRKKHAEEIAREAIHKGIGNRD